MNDTLNERTKRPTDCHQIKSNTQNSQSVSHLHKNCKKNRSGNREGKKTTNGSNVYYCFFFVLFVRFDSFSTLLGHILLLHNDMRTQKKMKHE